MDIEGLGESNIELFVNSGLIKTPADIYALKQEQIVPLERMAEQSANNLVAAINESKKNDLSKLIFALGIRHVGQKAAKLLSERFGTMTALMNASFDEIMTIDGFGAIMAKSVVEYFLRESKRGYCTYFATSAAVILRCAGIPARYCAGYTVNTNTGAYYTDGQSNKYMKYDVYDNAAHAWVEAYIDGYGWVIVDATPGYGEVEDTEQSSTQDESERQSQSDNSNSSVDENMTVDDTDEPGTESTAQEAASDTDSFSGEIHINSVLIVVCTAILAVLILIAMAAIRIVSRIHLLRSSSADEVKLMKMYSYLEKLLACLGYKREPGIDYEEYILEITAQDANLKNMGLEKAVQTILAVRFGNVKYVDKADITGIINTIRQVRSYALKKARGLKKLIVCLI